jgi:hypothetical protein
VNVRAITVPAALAHQYGRQLDQNTLLNTIIRGNV